MKSFRMIFSLVAITLIIPLSSIAQNNLEISGKLNNNTHDEIFLETMGKEAKQLGRATINTKGQFVLRAEVKGTDIYKLSLDKQNFLMLILSEGDKVHITANAEQINKGHTIKGSHDSELIYEGSEKLEVFSILKDSLDKVYNEKQNLPEMDSLLPVLVEEFKKVEKQEFEFIAEFVTKNKSSLASLFFIESLKIDDYFSTYKTVDSSLFALYPKNIFVQNLHTKVSSYSNLAIGNKAPELKFPNPDGEEIALSSLRGKVVLIDFWASWCGPCRRESPNLVKLYEKYNPLGFEIYGVSLDKKKESWVKAIQMDKLHWTHVSDLNYWSSEAAKIYGVRSIPYTVLVDKKGNIIAKGLRGEALEEKLKQIFRQ